MKIDEYSDGSYRLPKKTRPLGYDIWLRASPSRTEFEGKVVIDAKVTSKSAEVELHSRDLEIGPVRIRTKKQHSRFAPWRSVDVAINEDRETITLHPKRPLEKCRLQIEINFSGKLSSGMHGIYLARDGDELAVVSQCEATDARAIFPCWDEPEFKANFTWTVRTDQGLTVITNGKLVAEKPADTGTTKEVDHFFATTRKFSTYLVAVTIGRYDAGEEQRVSKCSSTFACGPGKLPQTRFAADVTAFVLPWYERYFAHRYAYDKLHQVAVPGFDAGAMENVGAIFYRQSLLLMDPKTSSFAAKKRIAEVVAHEIAHQWFGNLVTMKWWDDLWLNEAFATWIAYKACDEYRPDWRMWDDYHDTKQTALVADALTSTHPIYTPVNSPAEATELFDIITYEKGCAVLMMIEGYLGERVFRDALQTYIDVFRNRNATGQNLWKQLATGSGEPVDELMRSWALRPGFPLVEATWISSGSNDEAGGEGLRLRQRRFFAQTDLMRGKKTAGDPWMIPMVIVYGTKSGIKRKRVLFRDAQMDVILTENEPLLWAYPNADATGFYRTKLDRKLLGAVLRRGLGGLSPAARMGLLSDQWALVGNGKASIGSFMDVLCGLRDDDDYVVTRAITRRLGYLDERVVGDEARKLLSAFAGWFLDPQLESGWFDSPQDDDPGRAVRRAAVVYALGHVAGDKEVLKEATALMKRERRDATAVEANIAAVAINLSALTGDKRRLDSFVQTYLSRKAAGDSPELQSRYLSALAGFTRPATVKLVLSLCLDSTIPQEQLRVVLVPMLVGRATQIATWAFLKRHWNTIEPQIGAMGISRLVEATGSLPFSYRDDVETFFACNPVPHAVRAVQKALEAMDTRHELLEREQEKLTAWLMRRKLTAA